MFSDTLKGATASAQNYSLIETAKSNGQEPYRRLRHVLEWLPHVRSTAAVELLARDATVNRVPIVQQEGFMYRIPPYCQIAFEPQLIVIHLATG